MWFAGIDWADAHHDVVVIDEEGTRVGQLRVSHSARGVDQLIAWLRGIGDIATYPAHLACLIETTRRPRGDHAGGPDYGLIGAGLARLSGQPQARRAKPQAIWGEDGRH